LPEPSDIPFYGERLTIIKDGFSYTLPCGWSVKGDGDMEFRLKAEDKAFSHGGTASGDGKAKSRSLNIGFHVRGETAEEHDWQINQAYMRFSQQNYQLVLGRPDRLYNVAGLTKLKHKYIGGYKQRFSEVAATLLLADPFRYAARESVKRAVFLENVSAQPVRLHNPGSADTPLRIELIPLAAMPDVAISHEESGRSCRVRDSLLSSPAFIVVDTKSGTVRRGGFNAINAFSGQFLTALPGANTYKITAPPGEITLAHTARWFA
jgi:hypothetical protein